MIAVAITIGVLAFGTLIAWACSEGWDWDPDEPEANPMSEFTILGWGLMHARVCTTLPLDETTARLNAELPTGIDSRWEPYDGDEPEGRPVACADNPETHSHVLFDC